MNKLITIILAILGAMNIVFNMFLPIAIILMWIKVLGTSGMGFYLILIIGISTTIFRGIKVWINQE